MKYGYIYMIKNLNNNKKYIGQTIDAIKRKNEHFMLLKNKKHYNNFLQNAVNKHGINNFKFTIVEENIEKSNLNKREKYWIDYYNTFGKRGYNLTSGGKYNTKFSESTIQKLREQNIGKNNNMYGVSLPSQKCGMYGKTHTRKSRKKISRNHHDVSGLNNPRSKIKATDIYDILKLNYEKELNGYEIAKIYNVSGSLIYQILKLKHWTCSDLERRQ